MDFGFRGARFDFVRGVSLVWAFSSSRGIAESVRVARGRTCAASRVTPCPKKRGRKVPVLNESRHRADDNDDDLGRAPLGDDASARASRSRVIDLEPTYRGRSRTLRPSGGAARATARLRSSARRRALSLTSALASRVTATRERHHGRCGAARLRAAPARSRRRRGVDSGACPFPLDDAFDPPSPRAPRRVARPADPRDGSSRFRATPPPTPSPTSPPPRPPPPASIRLAAITPSSSARFAMSSSPRRANSSRDAWSPPSGAPTTPRRRARSPSTRTP